MNRRKFLETNSKVAVLAPFIPTWPGIGSEQSNSSQPAMPDWMVQLIKQNDQSLKSILSRTETDPTSSKYGSVTDGVGMVTAHSVTSLIKTGLNALLSEGSAYRSDPDLVSLIGAATSVLLGLQHADGTVDLVTTNFHSTPDNGFIVKWLAPGYRLLAASSVPHRERITKPLWTFLERAGEALKVGGIHTPNHRWVVCSALAELYKINPDPGYRKRAEQWLAERIDLDPDGQYNERSSYIYSSLSNRVLISTARGFDMPELLGYVRKNLEMTFYYIHPNGEIVTEASGRQDNSIVGFLENYYYPYRYLALKDQNPQFAAACRLIEQTAFSKVTGFLHYFLEDPSLWQELPKSTPLPVSYSKLFSHSGLARIRRGDFDASILANSAAFFNFHKKEAVLQGIRFASAFFGKGQFVSEHIEQRDGKFVLENSLQGPYYQPLPIEHLPDDGDWEKMPRALRPQSEVQQYRAQVVISEVDGGFALDIEIGGTDHVPFALEFIFRPGGTFSGVEAHPSLPDVYFLKSEMGTYKAGEDTITFGPGHHTHQWVDIRGGLPRTSSPTVYLTGMTPFRERFLIT
ncbi:hypothetical protein [Lunatimonas salinarum]|uniref:hypothetical protein n=1 Tax=Lunatimonas salinarum TaxID=1774590 RepID=UPI001ADFDD28|nr:hypothetical protein [Lunatimonas salinarum]